MRGKKRRKDGEVLSSGKMHMELRRIQAARLELLLREELSDYLHLFVCYVQSHPNEEMLIPPVLQKSPKLHSHCISKQSTDTSYKVFNVFQKLLRSLQAGKMSTLRVISDAIFPMSSKLCTHSLMGLEKYKVWIQLFSPGLR